MLGPLRPLIAGGLGDLQFVIELGSMNRYGCLSVEHVDTVGRAYKRFVLRRGPLHYYDLCDYYAASQWFQGADPF